MFMISLHTFHMPCFSGSPLLQPDRKPNTHFTQLPFAALHPNLEWSYIIFLSSIIIKNFNQVQIKLSGAAVILLHSESAWLSSMYYLFRKLKIITMEWPLVAWCSPSFQKMYQFIKRWRDMQKHGHDTISNLSLERGESRMQIQSPGTLISVQTSHKLVTTIF
jgi:hypothetical protein